MIINTEFYMEFEKQEVLLTHDIYAVLENEWPKNISFLYQEKSCGQQLVNYITTPKLTADSNLHDG